MNNSASIEPLTNIQSIEYSNFINKNTLIVARRGSGKTTFIFSIHDKLIKRTNFSRIYIVSPTDEYISQYSSHIPQATIVFKLTDNVINDLDNLPLNDLQHH